MHLRLTAGLVALLAAAPVARAATVTGELRSPHGPLMIEFQAAPGERNEVRLLASRSSSAGPTDRAAPTVYPAGWMAPLADLRLLLLPPRGE
jgi:hypothetical protein